MQAGSIPRLYLWRTYHTFTDKCLKCLLPRVVTGVISRCLFAALGLAAQLVRRTMSVQPWRTRYDRRTGPSHGLTAPSSLVQRDILAWLVS